MISLLRSSAVMLGLLTVLTGAIYPAVVTSISQLAFPHQANGSILLRDGKPIGSELVGQSFDAPQYFWSRPSATTPPYDGSSSSGSNLGPTNPDLLKAVKDRVEAIRKAHPDQFGPVPVDLVTTSASGLDPHISPAAAAYQVARVAQIRGLDPIRVQALVTKFTSARTFGILGEPRVNVVELNFALETIKP
jgi:K+-transporting ATPase ATPase C chain